MSANGLQIRAAVGLGQCDAAAQLAAGKTRQVVAFLRLGAESLHRRRHDQMGVEDPRHRHPHGGNTLDDLGVGHRRQTQAAILGIDGGAEQPQLLHLLDDGLGVGVGGFQLVGVGCHLALQEAIDAGEDQGLVVAADGGGHAFPRLGTRKVRSKFMNSVPSALLPVVRTVTMP